ncbi:GNAT family N-acetyltransferase [Actinoplanes sandaracinus]|nr:GNAT family N-acetyltransferase [Actinoplanes sandaracinus]
MTSLWADAAMPGGLRWRTLSPADAPLVVEATSEETAPALWGPRPVGPYTLADAGNALREWDPDGGELASYGILRDDRLLAAFGLMCEPAQIAEVAYWVPPRHRRQGLASAGLRFLTDWALTSAGFRGLWLEIDPTNPASVGVAERAGYRFDRRIPGHCRSWADEDPAHDTRHDCLIWVNP